MEKENFVIELPLKVEKWQEDLLNKRYELFCIIYNYIQNKLLKQFTYFEQMSEWKNCKTKKEKINFLKNHPFSIKGFDKPITFTEYDISAFTEKFCKKKVSQEKTYKDFGLNTTNLGIMGNHIWSAWSKKLFDKPKTIKDKKTGKTIIISHKIHFKKNGELNSISVRKKGSGFTGLDIDLERMILQFNVNGKTGKKSKKIILPIVFNKPTEYEMLAFKGGYETLRVVTIVRKFIRGKYKFYVQFTIDGEKPQKGRTLGNGNVGVDVGPSTIAVSSLKGVQINTLAEKCNKIDHKLELIDRKMDRSRRATNPENYQEDGQIKRDKNLVWKYSKHYIRLKNKRKELMRKNATIRKINHNIDANLLLNLGDTFIVEKNPVSAWAKRAKGIRKNKKGKNMSNKRYGKSIGNHAPSAFVTILKNKVESLGGKFKEVDIRNSASRFDFINGEFNEHNVKQRKIKLSNGNTHQRDMLAAFNLQHLVYESDNLKDYNINEMNLDYPIFCKLESKEIERYKNGQKQSHKSTVGY